MKKNPIAFIIRYFVLMNFLLESIVNAMNTFNKLIGQFNVYVQGYYC